MDEQFWTSVKSSYLWINSNYSGDRLNLWSGRCWGPAQGQESKCGARLLQHGHWQGWCHQPRGKEEFSLVFHNGKLLKSKAYFLQFYVHSKFSNRKTYPCFKEFTIYCTNNNSVINSLAVLPWVNLFQKFVSIWYIDMNLKITKIWCFTPPPDNKQHEIVKPESKAQTENQQSP